MKQGPRRHLAFRSRSQWRAWLVAHHASATEAWLEFWKVGSGRKGVRYVEAVEEALCFGWIDTRVERLDETRYVQRFTPRVNTRQWSRVNLERFERLLANGSMTDAGRAKLPPDVSPPPTRVAIGDPVPEDIASELSRHAVAQAFFTALAPGYRRDYVRWITEAKRPETRRRRLQLAVRCLTMGAKRPVDVTGRGTAGPSPPETGSD